MSRAHGTGPDDVGSRWTRGSATAWIGAVDIEIVTASARPDLEGEAAAAFRERWPEFIFHDPVPPRYMPRVHEYFADLDVLLLVGGRVAAGGWGVPFVWDGTPEDLPEGYDAVLARCVEDHESGRTPTAFSFMAAAVHPDHDKRGLAVEVLQALVQRATVAGISRVVALQRQLLQSKQVAVDPTWRLQRLHW